MTGRCALCGSSPADAHHITGRPSAGGAFFDDDLLLPLCRRHHTGVEGVHPVLRVLDLDFLPAGRAPVAHRLRRFGVHARLVADAGRPLILDPPAGEELGRLAVAGADELDGGSSDG